MRIETITRNGKEFAVIPVKALEKLMEDAEMLADVKAYDAAKAHLGVDCFLDLQRPDARRRVPDFFWSSEVKNGLLDYLCANDLLDP